MKTPAFGFIFMRNLVSQTGGRRQRRSPLLEAIVLAIVCMSVLAGRAWALTPGDLNRVTFEQHPGRQLPPDLVFRDENNRPFRLGDHFGGKPTIFVLGYYRCPMLCTLINDGLIQALQELRLDVGRDFQVVNVSIDPTEKAAAAAAKKQDYLRRYGRPGAAKGWHCLVGDDHSISQVADALGYHYAYDPQSHEYAHPSGIVIVTPEGKISHYLFGVNFNPRELLDSLVAAKQEQSSSVISQVLLLCYHYNPIKGKYGGLVLSMVRVGSIGFLGAIAWGIFSMTRRPARKSIPSD